MALIDVESTSMKAEAELVRDALSLTVENFKNSRRRLSRVNSPSTVLDTRTIEIRSKNYIQTWT